MERTGDGNLNVLLITNLIRVAAWRWQLEGNGTTNAKAWGSITSLV
jgi:hypothetical protein